MFLYIDALSDRTSTEMITILLIVATLLYCIQMILLLIGLRRADRVAHLVDFEPTVSVIIAARNEERGIGACLTSLDQLEYPRSKLQIIIVNDGSTDRTGEMVNAFARSHAGFTAISTSPGGGNLVGKTNAVAQGIAHSSGEILMFTDADCIVPCSWVRETVRYFEPSVGAVGGYTLLAARNGFEGMQTLDWLFLFGIAAASAAWNTPITIIGNNLSVRRTAYDATGGYEQIPFSVTEDHALVQAIVTRTDYRIAFPANHQMLVESRACENLFQLFRQKQRWGVGGLDMVWSGVVITGITGFMRAVLLIGSVSVPLVYLLIPLVLMLTTDLLFLGKPLRKFRALGVLKYVLLFELYYFIYVPVIPFVALLSRRVVWKERSL